MGRVEAIFYRAKLETDELVQIARVAIVVDSRLWICEGVLDGSDLPKLLVLHIDEMDRITSDFLGHGSYRGDRITDEPNGVQS